MITSTPCTACKTARPALKVYRPQQGIEIRLCDECREALLRDVLDDGSPGFVEFLLQRAGRTVAP